MEMAERNSYIKFEDLQECLTEFRLRTGERMGMDDAIQKLIGEGRVSREAEDTLDFSAWDIGKPTDLWKIYLQHRIYVNPVLKDPSSIHSFISEDYYNFRAKDVAAILQLTDEKAYIHTHDFFEVNYVLEGNARMNGIKKDCILRPGDLYIIAPGTPHSLSAEQGSVVIDLLIRRSTFQTSFAQTLQNDNLMSAFFNKCLYSLEPNYLFFHVDPDAVFCQVIRDIFSEAHSDATYANEICCSLVTILFAIVMRTYSETYSYCGGIQSVSGDIPLILAYIKENYKTLKLSELAAHFGYNASYLGKQLKKATGLPFNDITNQLKVQEGAALLTYSNIPIHKIAEIAGYNSLDHFSRTFKKITGISPTQYRNQHR